MIDQMLRKLLNKPALTDREVAERHMRHLSNNDLIDWERKSALMEFVNPDFTFKGVSAKEMHEIALNESERRNR